MALLLGAGGMWGAARPVVAPAWAAAGQPRVELPETSVDFGEVFQDRELSHTFVVKNKGAEVLKITKVDPDCACTVPSYDREIPPGKEGKITLKLKPYSVLKQFQKKTRIFFNDPDTPRAELVMKGLAKPVIEITPGHIISFKGDLNREHRAEVRFTSHLAISWEIREVKTNIPDKIEVELRTEVPGKVYVLAVKNKERQPGHYAGKIEMATNAAQRPRLLVRVFADLYFESAVAP